MNSPCVRVRNPLLILLIGLLFSSRGLAAGDTDQFAPVRERIQKAILESNVPSIAVAVAHKGEILWEQGFGLADRENNTPATQHTMYSVASVSKPVTATGLMVLVERGKVDLDKPINDYLGEAKLQAHVGDAAEATVRRVANHTSGLPLHYQFFYADESYQPPRFDETIRRYGRLVTAPGERYYYANLGYGLLDYVVERMGERKFADFMREEVFLPLGMTHTSIDIGPGLEGYQAIRYTADGQRIPFYTFDHPGASAVYSSAHDLVRFAMFHMKEHLPDQRAILKDESLDAMQVSTINSKDGNGYGIGWGTFTNHRGYACVQHTGGMPGVATTVRFVPAEHLAVVVLSNSRTPLAYRLPDMITDILLPEREDQAKKDDKKDSGATSGPGKFVPSAELIGKWAGDIVTHEGKTPLRLEFQDDGDVHVRLGDQLSTLLSGVQFHDGFLRGRFAGKVPYADSRDGNYHIRLELKLRGNVLNGSATTAVTDKWGENAVTHWVEINK